MGTVEIRSLTKTFPGGVTALDDLDLTVEEGEFFALLGPSGCGKTTLLRTIAGLEAPTAGRILIGGRDVTRAAPGDRGIGMVFQDYALYPHMTVRDNISYPLKVAKVPRQERDETAERAAGSLGLDGMTDRRPGQLSGGQQQRVAVARAVAARARVFLFDEPLSNLDARLRLEARTFLKTLQRELGTTTVYVTHDQSEALALADRMAVLDAGTISQVGAPSEFFHRPANLFVAGFIGSTPMNLLDAEVRPDGVTVAGRPLDLAPGPSPAAGAPVIVGIRPEYVSLGPPGSGDLTGRVQLLENLGTHHLVTVSIDGDDIVRATSPDGSEPEVGADVDLVLPRQRCLLYDGDGDLVPDSATEAHV